MEKLSYFGTPCTLPEADWIDETCPVCDEGIEDSSYVVCEGCGEWIHESCAVTCDSCGDYSCPECLATKDDATVRLCNQCLDSMVDRDTFLHNEVMPTLQRLNRIVTAKDILMVRYAKAVVGTEKERRYQAGVHRLTGLMDSVIECLNEKRG
jgi:malate synthase